MDLDIPGRTWFEAGILSNSDSEWQYDIHKSKTTPGGWSKHSCRCVIRNDLAPALALPCASQAKRTTNLQQHTPIICLYKTPLRGFWPSLIYRKTWFSNNKFSKHAFVHCCSCCFFIGKYSLESFLDTNQCSWIMMATTTMQHPRFMGSVIAWRSRGYDPHIHIINVYVLKIAPTTSLMARLLGARSDITNRCAFTIVWRNNLQPMTQRQK